MYNILLVDDEPMIKLGIRKLLEHSKYVISGSASNGMEALSLLDITPVDMILTDLKMPVMDGIEFICQLKARNFAGVILVLSNYSDFSLVRNALTEGASDYLLKNEITKEHLIRHLDKVSEELTSRIQTVRDKEALYTSRQELFRSQWKAYLSHTSNLSEDALQLLMPDPMNRLDCHLLLISLQYADCSNDKKQHVLTRLKDLLPDIFQISEHILILQTDVFEISVLIPSKACIHDIPAMHQILKRRISMYLNVTPLLAYGEHAATPAVLQEYYQQCHTALKHRFYYPDNTLFSILEYDTFQKGDPELARTLHKNVSDSLQHHTPSILQEALQNFLSACKRTKTDPDWVISTVSRLCEQFLFPSDGMTIHPEKQEYLQDLQNSRNYQQLQTSAVSLLFDRPDTPSCDPGLKDYAKQEIQTIIHYLSTHYTEKIPLEDLAKLTNLNKSYLCRLFKQETGMSILAYLNQIRMEKGAQYIRQSSGECNIKTIAAQVGIDDPFYFTRKFKTYFGQSPSDYARSLHPSSGTADHKV